MKQSGVSLLKLVLVFGDVLVVIISFALAYYYRIHYDARPYYFHPSTANFLLLAVTMLPIWLSVNLLSGLYAREIFTYRVG